MTQRSPIAVWLLSLVTFGIYALIWYYKTKEEMNQKVNAGIPSMILIIIPIANLYWIWKWAGGVERATNGKYGQAIAFILMLLVPAFFGAFLIQSAFNQAQPAAGGVAMQQAR